MNELLKHESGIQRAFPWIIPAVIAAAWWAVAELRLAPPYLLPHPGTILHAGYAYLFGGPGGGVYDGRFLADVQASLGRVALGFAVAAGVGIPLGVVSGRLRVADRLLNTTINGIRAVPGISWLPLAMVWFGIGLETTVFLIALAAFFPIYINTASGVRQVSPVLLQAGAMMGVRRLRGTFAILLPSAMPFIVSGLRLGLGISWAYLVLGELTGTADGLGALIMDARMTGRIDIIIVGIISISVIGRLSDQVLKTSMRLCLKSVRRAG